MTRTRRAASISRANARATQASPQGRLSTRPLVAGRTETGSAGGGDCDDEPDGGIELSGRLQWGRPSLVDGTAQRLIRLPWCCGDGRTEYERPLRGQRRECRAAGLTRQRVTTLARVRANSPVTGRTYRRVIPPVRPTMTLRGELECSTATGSEVTIGLPLPDQ